MKRFALLLVLCVAVPMWAKDKVPASDYQDAVLVSFRTITTGSSCSNSADTQGKIDATTDDNGNTTGTVKSTTSGSTNCSDTRKTFYTIRCGDQTYVLQRDFSGKQMTGAALSFGWSTLLIKSPVLANRLPGTALKVRSDGKHFYVRIGKKESMYSIVEAH